MEELKVLLSNYIDALVKVYKSQALKGVSTAEFIQTNGEIFDKRTYYTEVIGDVANCYKNCVEAIINYPHLYYCEGYAISEKSLLPLPHAWLITKDKKVIEPTPNWKEVNTAYYGVVFRKEYVLKTLAEVGYYSILNQELQKKIPPKSEVISFLNQQE